MVTVSSSPCPFCSSTLSTNIPKVRHEIIQFISDSARLFHSLLISDDRNYTLQDHLQRMKNPGVWATQLKIQAAVDLYGVPLYLFTPLLSGSGYQWYHYCKRTFAVPQIKHEHIELAHRCGNHFNCIVEADTLKPSKVPPILQGRHET